MHSIQKLILAVTVVIVALMFLFSPYYVTIKDNDQEFRTNLGYHLIWNPPTQNQMYERLRIKYPGYTKLGKFRDEKSFNAKINPGKLSTQIILVGLIAVFVYFLNSVNKGKRIAFAANLFYNESEDRIRALWRIIIQFFLSICVTIITYLFFKTLLSPELYKKYLDVIDAIATFPTIWFICRFIDKRKFKDLGFHFNKRWWYDFSFGIILAVTLWVVIFSIGYTAGWISISEIFWVKNIGNSFLVALVYPIISFSLMALREELLFRGYIMINIIEGISNKRISKNWTNIITLIISSVTFGGVHLLNSNASFLSTLSATMGGVILGLGFLLTEQLAIPIGFHFAWNLSQSSIFGFMVSGDYSSTVSLFVTKINGPSIWVGDKFGPEAGLLAIFAVVVGCFIIYLWTNNRKTNILQS